MADVHVAFHIPLSGLAQVRGKPRASETLTSGATSEATTAAAFNGEVVIITPSGGDVYAAFGPDPTATDAGWLLLEGQVYDFAVAPGDKVAVIDP